MISKYKLDLSSFLPDERYMTLDEALDAILQETRIEGAVIDLDGVLTQVNSHESFTPKDAISGGELELFNQVKQEYEVCIVTNRFDFADNIEDQVQDIEEYFGVPVLKGEDSNGKMLSKPDPGFYRQALAEMGFENPEEDAEKVVMLGDGPHRDIYGANRYGMRTIQVNQDGEPGFWFTNGPRNRYDFPVNAGKVMVDGIQSLVARWKKSDYQRDSK